MGEGFFFGFLAEMLRVVVWCIRSRTGWKNFRSDWCARCSWL